MSLYSSGAGSGDGVACNSGKVILNVLVRNIPKKKKKLKKKGNLRSLIKAWGKED